MSALKFNDVVSLIENAGRNVTFMVQGEPGIGKSTVGSVIAEHKGFPFAYLDMANISLGDLLLPVANRETRAAEFYPNDILKLHTGEPVVLMLDEWTKASKEPKNMTLPLVLERRLGSIKLHPDSIVFATGNLAGDGVGDSIQAHQLNRFILVEQRKPTADEWINDYAVNNDIDPTIITFVDQFPQVMESYRNDPSGENKYIFNPRRSQGAYVSGRSLKFASDILRGKEHYSDAALQAALAGAIGEVAAADLVSFVHMNEQLPPFASVVANPTKVAIPTEPVNVLLLVFNLIMRVDKETIVPVLKFINRLNNEMQGLFLNKILSAQSKNQWAAQVPEVSKMAVDKHYLFG